MGMTEKKFKMIAAFDLFKVFAKMWIKCGKNRVLTSAWLLTLRSFSCCFRLDLISSIFWGWWLIFSQLFNIYCKSLTNSGFKFNNRLSGNGKSYLKKFFKNSLATKTGNHQSIYQKCSFWNTTMLFLHLGWHIAKILTKKSTRQTTNDKLQTVNLELYKQPVASVGQNW